MTDRAKDLMNKIWEKSKEEDITEERLVSEILKIVAETAKYYIAQNDIIVLDKSDIIQLSEELMND